MIVLDTNVISELMRSQPDSNVVAWIAAQPRGDLYTTSVNEAELLHGIALLPAGRRRDGLTAAVAALFEKELVGRILPFESTAARCYAEIVANRRLAGQPIEGLDAMIAATALANKASVATRDIGGFSGCGLALINPWEEM